MESAQGKGRRGKGERGLLIRKSVLQSWAGAADVHQL